MENLIIESDNLIAMRKLLPEYFINPGSSNKIRADTNQLSKE